MRITQIMLAKGFGGAERYFVDLTNELAQRGHEVQAICHSRFAGRPALRQHKNLRIDTVNSLGPWDWFATRQIVKQLRDFNPAVVHGHLARAASLAGNACNRLAMPFAVKTHNYVDLKYYRNVDLFLPTTGDQKRYLLENAVAETRIQVIPNFSSLPLHAAVDLENPDRPLTFGAIGRAVKKKGFDVLINAFKQLIDAGVEARLIIAGDGECYKQLQAQVRRLKLETCVQLTGWVDDVAAFYNAIDVFVLPSLDEPFGIVVLEAMANHKPIISTKTQGPVEILDDTTAILVDVGKADELSRAMQETHENIGLAQQRAEVAAERFKENYSIDAVLPQLLQAYERMQSGNHC